MYNSRRLFVNPPPPPHGGVIISIYSGLPNEVGVQKESEMGLILHSDDESIFRRKNVGK